MNYLTSAKAYPFEDFLLAKSILKFSYNVGWLEVWHDIWNPKMLEENTICGTTVLKKAGAKGPAPCRYIRLQLQAY